MQDYDELIVYTKQGYDLRQFKGVIDRFQGPYKDVPRIMDSMGKLYERFDETQVVWCAQELVRCTPYDEENGENMHRIAADCRDIIGIVNSDLWEFLIGQKKGYNGPRSSIARKLVEQQGDCAEVGPKIVDELFDVLVIDLDAMNQQDSILLRYPFQHDSRILDVSPVTDDLTRESNNISARNWIQSQQ